MPSGLRSCGGGRKGPSMNLKEETLEKNTIYTGRIITVRNDTALLPNGKRASREVVEHPGGVTIAALTPEGELLFVRQ